MAFVEDTFHVGSFGRHSTIEGIRSGKASPIRIHELLEPERVGLIWKGDFDIDFTRTGSSQDIVRCE
jgi:hypothetical protein